MINGKKYTLKGAHIKKEEKKQKVSPEIWTMDPPSKFGPKLVIIKFSFYCF